jgi:hypothetical protein
MRPHGVRAQDWMGQQSFASQAKTSRGDMNVLREVLKGVGLPMVIEIPIYLRGWSPAWNVEAQEIANLDRARRELEARSPKERHEVEALKRITEYLGATKR